MPSSKKEKKRQTEDPALLLSATVALTPAEIEAYFAEHSITITVPKDAVSVTPILSFNELPIPQILLPAFADFSKPTPVQACSWPPMLDGRDVVGIAETGR